MAAIEGVERMDYEAFRIAYTERLMKIFNVEENPEAVRLLLKGYTSTDKKELDTIRNTNQQYLHLESDVLEDDFLLITVHASEDKPELVVRSYIRAMYEDYQKDGWDAIDEYIQNTIEHQGRTNTDIIDKMDNYVAIKDSLIVVLRNISRKQLVQRECVFQRMDDFAIVLYVHVGDADDGTRLVVNLPKRYFESWGVPEDEVFALALENTMRITKVGVIQGKTILINGSFEGAIPFDSDDDLEYAMEAIKDPVQIALVTSPNGDGAVSFFFPGMMDRLAKLFGGDYLVAPIGEDRMLFHKAGTIKPENIRNGLRRSNAGLPDMMLSENVYYYDAQKRRLKKR